MSTEHGVLPDMVGPIWTVSKELMSQQNLVQFFFAANDSDSQIADYDALQMAQRPPILEQSVDGVKRRHHLPPRRHLRE